MAVTGLGLSLLGCGRTAYVPPETPMPPNTVLLSQMMRELSAQPGFNAELLNALDPAHDGHGKKGPALLTPGLLDELRKRTLGQDWSGLDRFPGWDMRRITHTVRVVGHVAGKDATLEADSAAHPGAAAPANARRQWLDVGALPLDQAQTISLDKPSTRPGFSTEGIVSDLGHGVTRGDGPNALAGGHAESQWLADVLNRLAANGLEGSKAFAAEFSGRESRTPQDLLQELQSAGTDVTVLDARYFANFAHMHYKGADVMAPFWIDTGHAVPGAHGRHLLVPVSHAELEWQIRGPRVNADVSWYFGVDGKAEWRVMDTLDQAWVLKRAAHTYTGEQAIEATRLAAVATVAYMHLHETHAELPFGGYFAFGVCQDSVSAIEKKLTGAITLYPNTADDSFFTDTRDVEFNAMMRAVPKDRDAVRADPARIFGSLPAAPDADGHFSTVAIPGLAGDLNASYAAWKSSTWSDGLLHEPHAVSALIKTVLFFGVAIGLGVFFAVKTRNFIERNPVQRDRR
jgi:hypothetical protein